MSLIGINVDRENPPYTINNFFLWMPEFKSVTDIQLYFDELYPIANEKIFKSIFGVDWSQAMALCIAHYMWIIGQHEKNYAVGAKTLADIAGGGPATNSIMTSASIGGFSKTYDLDKSMISGDDKVWWNQSAYGKALMALFSTKAQPTIFVAVPNKIPGTGNYED